MQIPRRISYHTFMYSKMGSPTAEISGIVHFKSNAFDKTILKIYVNSSIGESYLLNVDRVTSGAEDETGFHCVRKSSSLPSERFIGIQTCFVISSWSSLGKLTR